MERDEVLSALREVAVEVLSVEPDQVVEDARFKEDLDADSLDLVELVMGLEERFDISDFLRIYSGHCNLCSSNFGGEDFRRNNFVTNSQGLRVVDPTGTNTAQASKLISWMVYVSPEISNRIDESTITFDSAVVADDPAKPGLEVVRY